MSYKNTYYQRNREKLLNRAKQYQNRKCNKRSSKR